MPTDPIKGRFSFSWGYNRSVFTQSDIRLQGKGYDFTLEGAIAKDRPSFKTAGEFFKGVWHTDLSIPQYNVRLAYGITKNLSIAVGSDHMKYVMVESPSHNDFGQAVTVSGYVSPAASPQWAGVYDHTDMRVGGTGIVSKFEHTNGLNYIKAEAEYSSSLWRSKSQKFGVSLLTNAGAGGVLTKTEATVMDKNLDAPFHFSGFGVHGGLGLRVDLFKSFFIQARAQGGYMNLSDVPLVEGGKASHEFFYGERMLELGVSFKLSK